LFRLFMGLPHLRIINLCLPANRRRRRTQDFFTSQEVYRDGPRFDPCLGHDIESIT
jgi:hypothetical protein